MPLKMGKKGEFMKKLLSVFLSICFLMSSVVHAEVSAEWEMQKQFLINLESGKVHFNQLDEMKMGGMSLETFESKLEKALMKIQKRNNKILEEGTADVIASKYHKMKKTLLQNDRDSFWANHFLDIEKEVETSYLPEKGWLKKINSNEFRDKFKNDVMDDVKASGSVKSYYKTLKKKLFHLKKNEMDFPIEHVLLVTFALMIIVGIFLIIFCPIGGAAFLAGLLCVSTPMVFFLILLIRQLIDPITCQTNGIGHDVFYAV